jgi:PAS domain S-box-containing protein
VLATGKAAWVADIHADPTFVRLPTATSVGIRSALAFPVMIGSRVVGVLEFFSLQAADVGEHILEVMSDVGVQLGRVVERSWAEQALRESEMRFRSVAESAIDAIISSDSSGKIISWNRGAALIFGYTEGEALGKPLTILMPERYRRDHEAGMARVNATGESRVIGHVVEMHGLRKDGTEFPLELSLGTWKTGESTFYSGVIRDITQRKQAEEEIRRSRDYYLTLLEDFPALIWRSGVDGECDYFNRTWLAFTGRTMEQELGDGWVEGVHPEDAERCVSTYYGSFQSRDPFVIEYRLRRHDGQYRWVVDYGVPIRDANDRFLGYLGSCYDVTEAREAEEEIRKLNAELERRVAARTAQLEAANQELKVEIAERKKLEAQKDEFISVASHELRTPLTAIKGFSQIALRLAQRSEQGDARLEKYLETINDKADDLTRLVTEMLDVSRIERGMLPLECADLDLLDAVRRVVGNIQLTEQNTAFTLALPPEPVIVHADERRLEQVLTNLLDNAIKYANRIDSARNSVEVRVEVSGDEAIASVRDYGLGIPAGQIGSVFSRFFRADNVKSAHYPYPGLGLGLYISRGIVERHGGRMWVESKEGEGSTFYFALPMQKA